MAKLSEAIDQRLREFIEEQPMFFRATAPGSGGNVNLSLKGYEDTFSVLDERTVVYLDPYGSGFGDGHTGQRTGQRTRRSVNG